jgi:hypothetical protein
VTSCRTACPLDDAEAELRRRRRGMCERRYIVNNLIKGREV